MKPKIPAGPIPAILPDVDLIAIGGVILRLSAICYAQPVTGGLILYLNHGRLFVPNSGGAQLLVQYLSAKAQPVPSPTTAIGGER